MNQIQTEQTVLDIFSNLTKYLIETGEIFFRNKIAHINKPTTQKKMLIDSFDSFYREKLYELAGESTVNLKPLKRKPKSETRNGE